MKIQEVKKFRHISMINRDIQTFAGHPACKRKISSNRGKWKETYLPDFRR